MFFQKFLKSLASNFSSSYKELKSLKIVVMAGLMVAAYAVLNSVSIVISPVLEIRFSHLPIAFSGMMFGPVVAGIVGGISDIPGYYVHPTGPFFPGFTISNFISGIIYGLIFYNEPKTVKGKAVKSILAAAVNAVVIDGLLVNLWISMLYKSPYFELMLTRLPKIAFMFALNSYMFFIFFDIKKRFGKNFQS